MLNDTQVDKPVTACSQRLNSMDAHTVHSMYVFKVQTDGACKDLLQRRVLEHILPPSCSKAAAVKVTLTFDLPGEGERLSFPTGINK